MRMSKRLLRKYFEETGLLPQGSFAEDSHVRTSARRAQVLGSREADLDCGESTPDWAAKYDPNTSSWRTSQLSLIEGWEEFSATWPRSGTMRNGTAYQFPPLVRHTD